VRPRANIGVHEGPRRTGYGVRFGDDREVADGLAYWATAFVPLGPVGTERVPHALLESVHAARNAPS